MKNANKFFTWIAGLVIAMFMSHATIAQPNYAVNYQVFYNELDPYGSWIDYPGFGYVWSPNVGQDFRPYATNGYWVMTEYGNTWVSNYNWGWAPFHYGRWMFDDFYGWLWIPGNEWAPAWVAWRSGGGYYGWAPLGPHVNINISFNHYIPHHHWVFLPHRYIGRRTIHHHYVQPRQVVNIINKTVIVNHVHHSHHYFTGPSQRELSRATGRRVEVYAVNNYNRPGRTSVTNRSIDIYRPSVESNRRHERPERITRYDNRGRSDERGSNLRDTRTSRETTPRSVRENESTNDSRQRVERENRSAQTPEAVRPAQPVERSRQPIQESNRTEIERGRNQAAERNREEMNRQEFNRREINRKQVDSDFTNRRQQELTNRSSESRRMTIEKQENRNFGERQRQEVQRAQPQNNIEMRESNRQERSRPQQVNPQRNERPAIQRGNERSGGGQERRR